MSSQHMMVPDKIFSGQQEKCSNDAWLLEFRCPGLASLSVGWILLSPRPIVRGLNWVNKIQVSNKQCRPLRLSIGKEQDRAQSQAVIFVLQVPRSGIPALNIFLTQLRTYGKGQSMRNEEQTELGPLAELGHRFLLTEDPTRPYLSIYDSGLVRTFAGLHHFSHNFRQPRLQALKLVQCCTLEGGQETRTKEEQDCHSFWFCLTAWRYVVFCSIRQFSKKTIQPLFTLATALH